MKILNIEECAFEMMMAQLTFGLPPSCSAKCASTLCSRFVRRFISATNRMREAISKLSKGSKPTFGGDRFLTDIELTKRLKISDRTTQDWRSKGKIDYLQFEANGKVLYRESDIQKFLEKHYQKAWKTP